MKISKIISGGQTGVDQAALDAAIELGIRHAGFVPKGRLSEEFCNLKKKAVLTINILDEFTVVRVNLDTWLETNTISILNIAGPRESEVHIYEKTKDLLIRLLKGHVV